MSKNTKANNANVATVPALNWETESARIVAAAKDKPGSRGDAMGRLAGIVAQDTPASALIRKACGERGAQAIIDQPRNVLGKISKLATCIATGTPWCSALAVTPEGRRKEDASVVVALGPMLKEDAETSHRQKAVIIDAQARYPGGAGAQMPAALEALAFMGLVNRKPGAARNAEYELTNKKAALKLIPQG